MTDDETGNLIEASFSFSGDVLIQEEPMDQTRSEESGSEDLYGIQVYQNGQKYAYGLFDNPGDMKIFLHTGKTYSFVCTLIKNGKNYVYFQVERTPIDYIVGGGNYWQDDPHFLTRELFIDGYYTTTVYNKRYEGNPSSQRLFAFGSGYTFPFVLTLANSISLPTGTTISTEYQEGTTYYCSDATPLENSFVYSSSTGMDMISKGITISNASKQRTRYPNCVRYYGVSDNFTASGTNKQININLKAVGFGLQYKVSGVTDGTVSLSIKNDDKTFFEKNNITSSYTSEVNYWSFENIEEAYSYNDYTENLTVSMKWMRGVGIEQDLGSQMVQVKRGAVNVIEIALDTN